MPLAAVLLLFTMAALVAALLPARARNGVAVIAGASALAGLIGLAIRFPGVRDGGVSVKRIAWVPSLGLELVLRLDGFSWMFCVLVLGIGALVMLYARYYLSPSDPVPRFFAFLLAFMGAMLGVVLSGNLLQLAFFWELTSLFRSCSSATGTSGRTRSAGRAWRSRSPGWAACACSPACWCSAQIVGQLRAGRRPRERAAR